MPTIPYDASREALYHSELRPTLFAAGAGLPTKLIALEAARLAYLRADTSDVDRSRLAEALSRVGFGAPTPFAGAGTGTFGFGAFRSADRTALVAFRGTQPDDLRDLVTDLRALPLPRRDAGGRVHEGFAEAAHSVLPKVSAWLDGDAAGRTSLILTGHSLGGAIATLAAAILRPTLLVTLGSPRVGDAAFAATIEAVPTMRVVDCADIVSRVPPAELGYVHAGAPTYVTAAGLVEEAPTKARMDADRLRASMVYPLRYAWIPGNVLCRSFADHAPINYLRAFFA